MTKRHFVSLLTGLLLSLAAVQGATADTVDPACPTTGTYQTLLDTNAVGGCTINVGGGVSLMFSDFTFTPAGVGTPTAAQVGYTLDDPGTGPFGEQIFGFEFNPGLSASGPDGFQDIRLTYKIVPVGTMIISNDLLANVSATGTGVGETSEILRFCIASDPNNTSGDCGRTFRPLLVTTGPPPVLEDNATFGPWTSMTVDKDMIAFTGAGGGTAVVSGVRDAVDLTAIPEPTTYGLVTMGLLTIGYFGRRRSAR